MARGFFQWTCFNGIIVKSAVSVALGAAALCILPAPAVAVELAHPSREDVIKHFSTGTGFTKDSLELFFKTEQKGFDQAQKYLVAIDALNKLYEAKDEEAFMAVGNEAWNRLKGKLMKKFLSNSAQTVAAAIKLYWDSLQLLKDHVVVPALNEEVYRRYAQYRDLSGGSVYNPDEAQRMVTHAGAGNYFALKDRIFDELIKSRGYDKSALTEHSIKLFRKQLDDFWTNRLEARYQLEKFRRDRPKIMARLEAEGRVIEQRIAKSNREAEARKKRKAELKKRRDDTVKAAKNHGKAKVKKPRRITDQDGPKAKLPPSGKAAGVAPVVTRSSSLPPNTRIVPWAESDPRSVCYAYHNLAKTRGLHKGLQKLKVKGVGHWDKKSGTCQVTYSGEVEKNGNWQPMEHIELTVPLEHARRKLILYAGETMPADKCPNWKSFTRCLKSKHVCTAQITRKSCKQWAGDIDRPYCKRWEPYTVCSKREWFCHRFKTERYCDHSKKAKRIRETPKIAPRKTAPKARKQTPTPPSSGADACKGLRGSPRPGLNPVKLQAWMRCNKI